MTARALGAVLIVLVVLVATVPAHAARPRLRVDVTALTAKRAELLDRGAVQVRVRANRRVRARFFATLGGNVATGVRELRLRPGRARTFVLPLGAAGRGMAERCAGTQLAVHALHDRGVRETPRRLAVAGRALVPGGQDCSSPPPLPVTPADGGGERCDPIDPAVCLQPFPNDHFTVRDATTATGRRVNLHPASMPRNVLGVGWDPGDHNRNDGFSPGSSIVTKVPGLDTPQAFSRFGLVPIGDMARAFDRTQPVVVIDAGNLRRHLVWAELDSNPASLDDVNLIVRPGRNFHEGRRYIVALRRLPGEPTPSFRALRDALPTADPFLERRRPHMESVFATLAAAGVDRRDLHLAWDFTVASERSLSERMLTIRDDAFRRLGDADLADMRVAGRSPSFVVDRVIEDPDGPQAEVARRIEGRVTVPCYLDLPGCPSGARFAYPPDRAHGPPTWDRSNTTEARFTCHVPRVVLQGGAPARVSLYGHGLLGSRGELGQGQLKAFGQEHRIVFCATDWVGMACSDVDTSPDEGTLTDLLERFAAGAVYAPNCDLPNIATLLLDLSRFPSLVDRVQQGMLNFLYLGRAMIHPQGFASHPAFSAAGRSLIETGRLYYDGNSQGGIIGGALIAVAPDLDRGVIGVPGMNYSTLLTRSVDFDAYAEVLYRAYPSELERPLLLALLQMLWDRGEANGYAQHMTRDPYANTPPHEVLMHVALGDHQVAQVSAEVEARTIGAHARSPWADPGRDTDRGKGHFDIPAIRSYPFAGSAIVLWDSGPPRTVDGEIRGTPPPPEGNTPPRAGDDPHEYPRRAVAGRRQKSEFLRPGGRVQDQCAKSKPCYSDGWTGP